MEKIAKLTIERFLIGRDWTLDLDGATINTVPDPVVEGPTGLTCTKIDQVGNVTRYWLAGGSVGSGFVQISITTSEGETLGEKFLVSVT